MLRTSFFFFAAFLFIVPFAAAGSPPIWIKPALVEDAETLPLVDGNYAFAENLEYVKGKRIPLANWMGDWPGFSPPDGEVYIQIHSRDSPIYPKSMFIGVKIPRLWNQDNKADVGELSLYFAFNDDECAQDEDREIRMTFHQPNAPAASVVDPAHAPAFTTTEYKGKTIGHCFDAVPLDGAQKHLLKSDLKMDEFGNEKFLFAEFEVALPEHVFIEEGFRFGLRYADEDYGSANCPRCCSAVLTLPNNPLAQQGTPDTLNWGRESTYQVLDFKEPELTSLGVSIYNVGQMLDLGVLSIPSGDLSELSDVFVENGGVGDPEDIAKAIWSRDIVCLTEVMMAEDREEILEEANKHRKSNNLTPFHPVMVETDDPPNVMILTSWRPILPAEILRFSTIDSNAGGPDDLFFGSARGAKGVAYARLAPPPKCKYGPPTSDGSCPENVEIFDPTKWIDVFCTHTQAPCSPSPLIGSDDLCDDQKDHHLNSARQRQFEALGKYIKQKRAVLSPFGGDGFDRPALLLGDLNQVGPRSIKDNWGNNGNMDDWLVGDQPTASNDIYSGNKGEIAKAYRQMREHLGNWYRTDYDRRVADEYISGYDLTAHTNFEGTWIGQENSGGTSKKESDDCTTSFPEMKKEARIDYIMLIPATIGFPAMTYRWAAGKPQNAIVDKHFKPTSTFSLEDEGCLSDHAEAIAYIELVPATLPKVVNPFRENRLFYGVGELFDVEDEDDTIGDDGTTDWYARNFYLQTTDHLGNETGKCQADWGTDITPAGRTSTPGWKYRSYPMKDKDVANIWLEVNDEDSVSDDYYDSHSRSPCKHTEITFKLDTLEVTEKGCTMNHTRVMDKGKGLAFASKGNGDAEDVQLWNIFGICEINHDPGCDLITGP